MAGVLDREVDQLAARSALRRDDLRVLERYLDELAFVGVERDEELRRAVVEPQIAAREVQLEGRRVGFPFDVLEKLLFAREQLAAADSHQRDRRVVAVTRIAQHVTVAAVDRQHDRRLGHRLEVVKRVAQLGGPFEVERRRCFVHPPPDPAGDFIRPPLEEDQHLVDHRRVLGLRLCQDARRLAAMDVVVEAWPLRHLLRHVVVARAHREQTLHDIERAAHRADVRVRAEVLAPVVDQPARDQHARERLGDRDLDVRVRLVVAQRDVVLRPMLLDEIGLEDQRVRLARHHDRIEVRRGDHQRLRLDAPGVVGGDVVAHARPQPLGLPDVQNRPVRVAPEIHAGRLGQVRDLVENGLLQSHAENYPRREPLRRRRSALRASGTPRATVAAK